MRKIFIVTIISILLTLEIGVIAISLKIVIEGLLGVYCNFIGLFFFLVVLVMQGYFSNEKKID